MTFLINLSQEAIQTFVTVSVSVFATVVATRVTTRFAGNKKETTHVPKKFKKNGPRK